MTTNYTPQGHSFLGRRRAARKEDFSKSSAPEKARIVCKSGEMVASQCTVDCPKPLWASKIETASALCPNCSSFEFGTCKTAKVFYIIDLVKFCKTDVSSSSKRRASLFGTRLRDLPVTPGDGAVTVDRGTAPLQSLQTGGSLSSCSDSPINRRVTLSSESISSSCESGGDTLVCSATATILLFFIQTRGTGRVRLKS